MALNTTYRKGSQGRLKGLSRPNIFGYRRRPAGLPAAHDVLFGGGRQPPELRSCLRTNPARRLADPACDSVVVMAEVQDRVVVDDREAKVLQPS